MMLSAQAARMGCVRTTLRQISRRKSHSMGHRVRGAKGFSPRDRRVPPLGSDLSRWKSTMTAYPDSEDENESIRSHGHAEAAKVRSSFS